MLTCSYLKNLRRQYIDKKKIFVRPNSIVTVSSLLNATHPARVPPATLRELCLFMKGTFDSLQLTPPIEI